MLSVFRSCILSHSRHALPFYALCARQKCHQICQKRFDLCETSLIKFYQLITSWVFGNLIPKCCLRNLAYSQGQIYNFLFVFFLSSLVRDWLSEVCCCCFWLLLNSLSCSKCGRFLLQPSLFGYKFYIFKNSPISLQRYLDFTNDNHWLIKPIYYLNS